MCGKEHFIIFYEFFLPNMHATFDFCNHCFIIYMAIGIWFFLLVCSWMSQNANMRALDFKFKFKLTFD